VQQQRDPRRAGSVVVGDLRIDFGAHEVWRDDRRVALRPKEFALLRALLRANGCAVTRECLLQEVWGYTEGVLSRTLDTHVRSLRQKLEDDPAEPRYLLTVRSVGYRFALD
jgi:two-component system alkaline phosphatase synthesis response regulator PhoP